MAQMITEVDCPPDRIAGFQLFGRPQAHTSSSPPMPLALVKIITGPEHEPPLLRPDQLFRPYRRAGTGAGNGLGDGPKRGHFRSVQRAPKRAPKDTNG